MFGVSVDCFCKAGSVLVSWVVVFVSCCMDRLGSVIRFFSGWFVVGSFSGWDVLDGIMWEGLSGYWEMLGCWAKSWWSEGETGALD